MHWLQKVALGLWLFGGLPGLRKNPVTLVEGPAEPVVPPTDLVGHQLPEPQHQPVDEGQEQVDRTRLYESHQLLRLGLFRHSLLLHAAMVLCMERI